MLPPRNARPFRRLVLHPILKQFLWSPNTGVIAEAAVGGSISLLLLLLGIYLYWLRKQSARVTEQPSPIHEKMEECLPSLLLVRTLPFL